ncbi:hypothetical protein BS618_07635 [Rhodococcus erythropolis]|uniref:hypothetical protein n=1 Tax=Rhodococcus qingshengii TaxID=334542 RepID=UPI00093736FA|nr:hypothetical protein [Rhodococcus qingshengii]MCZ4544950.1 hypothetical protein [Rhodococcus qingshengii]OKA15797.1 hypothetical protein BS618_07635 [Rhodococcus erythropolis]
MKWLLIVVLIVGICVTIAGGTGIFESLNKPAKKGWFESDKSFAEKKAAKTSDLQLGIKILTVGLVLAIGSGVALAI